MGEKNEELVDNQKLSEIQSEAMALLEDIKKIKSQTEQQLKAAEAARRGADEHASYANQAKVNTEEHSKATAVFKGNAESDQNTISTNKQKSDELLAALTRGKADVDADAKVISERRKDIDQATEEFLATSKTGTNRLQEIESFKNSAEATLKTIEQARDKANLAYQKIESAKVNTESLSTQANGLLTKITENHKTSTDLSKNINDLLKKATKEEETLEEISSKLTKSHEVASEFEAKVIKLSADLESLIKRTEGLLPGVTSASLASAFADQKKRFAMPKEGWLRVFIGCIIALIIVAMPSFLVAIFGDMSKETWTDIFRCLIMRLPIVIPLVWLAIYAGRNYMLSVRLEEDYAYKEAISMAFEGYKREMEKIATDQATGSDKPIITLCVNVLKAIAERPGRIYDGKQKDITLQNEAYELLRNASEFSKKQISTEE